MSDLYDVENLEEDFDIPELMSMVRKEIEPYTTEKIYGLSEFLSFAKNRYRKTNGKRSAAVIFVSKIRGDTREFIGWSYYSGDEDTLGTMLQSAILEAVVVPNTEAYYDVAYFVISGDIATCWGVFTISGFDLKNMYEKLYNCGEQISGMLSGEY
ncbi:MAG: hypothetical protein ACTSUO_00145 [Candidatus Thorarchaeota archaeon]